MAGRPIKDLTGQRFGRLEAIKLVGVRSHYAYWLVRCDCGSLKVMRGRNLKETLSCGCLRSELAREAWRRRKEREKADSEKKLEDRANSQMTYNQEAGKAFDDFWMFGPDGEEWWNRITI